MKVLIVVGMIILVFILDRLISKNLTRSQIIKSKNRYFYLSGAIVVIFCFIVGNYHPSAYALVCLWFGFWGGVSYVVKYVEDLYDKEEVDLRIYKLFIK